MKRLTYILGLLLVFLPRLALAQTQTWQAAPGYVQSIQAQLNNLQSQINGFLLPPSATAGQFVVENAAGTAYVAATITGDVSASVSTPGKLTINPLNIITGTGTNPKIVGFDVDTMVDLCAHGFGCNTQRDNAASVTNGLATITLSGNGGVNGTVAFFAPTMCNVSHGGNCTGTSDYDIKLYANRVDTFIGTIVGYTSPTQATLSSNYTGTTGTVNAIWGSDDVAAWNTLNALFGQTLGRSTPGKYWCHAPILAKSTLVWGTAQGSEFMGSGPNSAVVIGDNTVEAYSGCIIIDMNPTAGTDVLQVNGNSGAYFHRFGIEGSTMAIPNALLGITEATSTATQNRFEEILGGGGSQVLQANGARTGACVPSGATFSGNSITCTSAPTGLQPNQYVQINDSTSGYEMISTSSSYTAGSNPIVLASNLAVTHTTSQATINFSTTAEALAGIQIEPGIGANEDNNSFQDIDMTAVDVAYDSRNQQSVTNTMRRMHGSFVGGLVALYNGGDLTLDSSEFNNATGPEFYINGSGRISAQNATVQPSTLVTASNASFAMFGSSGGAIRCEGCSWPFSNNSYANGDVIETGPASLTANVDLANFVAVASTSVGAPIGVPETAHFFTNTNAVQSYYLHWGYRTTLPAYQIPTYVETGTASANSARYYEMCDQSAYSATQPGHIYNGCYHQAVVGASTPQDPFVQQVPGVVQAGEITTEQLGAPTMSGAVCPTAAGATTYKYFATQCTDALCSTGHESLPSAGLATDGNCTSPLTGTNYALVSAHVSPLASAVRFYRCTTTCAASGAALEFTVHLNNAGYSADAAHISSETGVKDDGSGTNSGAPPAYDGTGALVAQGPQQYPNPVATAIAGLPTCNAGATGLTGFQVTNATVPCNWWATPVATGSPTVQYPVRCDGTSWRCSN